MAKVGKHTVTINGKLTFLEVFYTQKDGFSYKGLPEEFVKMMNWSELRFDTEDIMKNQLYHKLIEYHEQIKKTRKVILISLEGSLQLISNQTGHGSYSGHKPNVSKFFNSITNAPDYCFGFEYRVLYEVQSETSRYHHVAKDGGVGTETRFSSNHKMIIDWTPEREQFLIDLGGNVQQLIYAVSAFFDNPEALKLMDIHGIKALNPPNHD